MATAYSATREVWRSRAGRNLDRRDSAVARWGLKEALQVIVSARGGPPTTCCLRLKMGSCRRSVVQRARWPFGVGVGGGGSSSGLCTNAAGCFCWGKGAREGGGFTGAHPRHGNQASGQRQYQAGPRPETTEAGSRGGRPAGTCVDRRPAGSPVQSFLLRDTSPSASAT